MAYAAYEEYRTVYGGINADMENAHTIMNVEDLLFGSESVQHIEVTAV